MVNQNIMARISPTIRSLSQYTFLGFPVLEKAIQVLIVASAFNVVFNLYGLRSTAPYRGAGGGISILLIFISATVNAAKSGRNSVMVSDFIMGGAAFLAGLVVGASNASGLSVYSRRP
jgi:hypothetical protein